MLIIHAEIMHELLNIMKIHLMNSLNNGTISFAFSQ
jgi:hypothetical protein